MSKQNKTKYLESDKFRLKCQKKFRFLNNRDLYKANDFETLFSLVLEITSVFKPKGLDEETYNRIISHPQRLIYHANNILRLSNNNEVKQNRQRLNELKVAILYHDVSKCVEFSKYNGERRRDHALFSSIMIEIIMTYLEFDQDVINRISANIRHHSDKRPGYSDEINYEGILLTDIDILDEQDVYGLLLLSAVRGGKEQIMKNNMINQNGIKEYFRDFIENTDALKKMELPESIEYYTNMLKTIEEIRKIISFENEEVFI